MLMNLIIGVSTMMLCLVLQSLIIMVAAHYYIKHSDLVNNTSFKSTIIVLNGVMLVLVFGNLIQLTIWALLFLALGEFNQLSEAVYHSAVNYATLGYGDIVMSDKHKLLGPLESLNGILMVGVTTATLMATFSDSMKKTVKARRKLN
ncbi:MAG: ion channel [Pseudomonadota bacterium]